MGGISEAIAEQVPSSANGVTTMKEKKKGHALVMCMFFQAHFAGIYRMSLALAKKGVTITFPGPTKHLSRVQSSDELRGLDFNFVALADDPDALAFDQLTPLTASILMEKAFQPYLEKLLADQKAGVTTPSCIIADRFMPWTAGVAKQLKIPHYLFFSNGSVGARFKQALPQLISQGALKVVDNKVQEFDGVVNISGLPPLRFQDIPFALRQRPFIHGVVAVGRFIQGSHGIVMNTFYDLGAASIDALDMALRETSPRKDSRAKVFPIGPISTGKNFKDKTIVSELEGAGPECVLWLDEQPPLSVLFICLGSGVRLAPPQIHELASALEASQERFLWILPSGGGNFSKLDDVLPPGYRARLQGRGKVVNGWVPQLQLLGHSSVGGFLTHCGWNSIIESILMGVPMLAWPQQAEQHLNCRFLVTEVKTAVEIGGDGPKQQSNDPIVMEAEAFERAISRVMKEEEGRAMRKIAQDLKVKAHAAVEADGTSQKALEEFVDLISSQT